MGNIRRARTLARQKSFLAAYQELASVTEAAIRAKIRRKTHYEWLAEDPTYRPRFEQVQEEATQALEDEAVRRAVAGIERKLFHQGRLIRSNGKVQTETEFSDMLLLALLKKFAPDKYRERTTTEHTGSIDLVERLRSANERLIALKRSDPGTGAA
jgi:hypothetical protein